MNLEEVKQVAGNVEASEVGLVETPLVNIPLTDGQKLTLRTYQSRLTTLAKQKSEIDVQIAKIEGAMQVDMMKIAMTNNIDPEQFGFNDNLEIIPTPKQGPGGP